MKRIINLQFEVHESMEECSKEELIPFFQKNPKLYLVGQAGCSLHKSLVFVLRTDNNVELDSMESSCLLDMLRGLQPEVSQEEWANYRIELLMNRIFRDTKEKKEIEKNDHPQSL